MNVNTNNSLKAEMLTVILTSWMTKLDFEKWFESFCE